MLDATCEAMARGGMYDQLGGGFARYSVDRGWVVPHFEKMLYDNAQLLGLYARWGGPTGERVAAETADFMLRELRTDEGGFASALDADSEGVEGKFYAWTPAELADVLGEEDGAWAARLFEVTDAGTFEHGASTLQLLADPDDHERYADVRARLLAARETRVRPARDDKVVAAWNGLAISGLCDAGLLLGRASTSPPRPRPGELLARLHVDADGRLLRVSRDGVAGRHAGVLEDHGCVASGYLSLAAGHRRPGLADPRGGPARRGAGPTSARTTAASTTPPTDAEALVARPRDPSDNASPSGLSAMVHALSTYAALTGSGRHRQAAEEALRHRARARRAGAPVRGLVAGRRRRRCSTARSRWPSSARPAPDRDALERTRPAASRVRSWWSPTTVATTSRCCVGRSPVDGRPAAYVCRNLVCERPVTDPALIG